MPTAERRIDRLLLWARDQLAETACDTPRADAESLLAFVLEVDRGYFIAWPERRVGHSSDARYCRLIERRVNGEPTAYLTGSREFWSLPLQVTPATLIPRPETELLVEQALARIPIDAAWQIADLGTGCGAIAAAIASERPRCNLTATDASAAALQVANGNFARLGLDNVHTAQGSWFAALSSPAKFQLIVSNPPYIADKDPHLAGDGLPWEPAAALSSGHDGLDAIREITAQAPDWLQADGWLLLEHGFDQGERVRALLAQQPFNTIDSLRDLAGHERVTLARRG